MIETRSWCNLYDRPIDYILVKVDRPKCIETQNGCANCRYIGYRTVVM